MRDTFWSPETDAIHWKVKGIGRIIILIGIGFYGIGLLLKRMWMERDNA